MSKKLIETIDDGNNVVQVHRDAEWDEYVVTYKNAPADRKEATSYHTGDKQDALDTGRVMADSLYGWNGL